MKRDPILTDQSSPLPTSIAPGPFLSHSLRAVPQACQTWDHATAVLGAEVLTSSGASEHLEVFFDQIPLARPQSFWFNRGQIIGMSTKFPGVLMLPVLELHFENQWFRLGCGEVEKWCKERRTSVSTLHGSRSGAGYCRRGLACDTWRAGLDHCFLFAHPNDVLTQQVEFSRICTFQQLWTFYLERRIVSGFFGCCWFL